ncbi:MAG: selenide, water dikinase SelD [Isosphaeraceae bacterium]
MPQSCSRTPGARVGDLLVLTKPLGTGFITTAAKREQCPRPVMERAVAQMIELNAIGRDALRASGGVHALTDVTGYGLAGHACEMAEGAGLTFRIDVAGLPMIEGAGPLAIPQFYNRANTSNRKFLEGRIRVGTSVDPVRLEFVFDAQTSGGLLMAVAPEHTPALVEQLRARGAAASAIVGSVVQREGPLALILE